MSKKNSPYPVQFNVDYPEKPLSRWSTLFRIILIIPILIVLFFISSSMQIETEKTYMSFGGILFFAPLLMILFCKKYPRWWFNWNLELTRFVYRIYTYAFLLRDEYPATDAEQAVHVDFKYPDATKLNRFLPLVKWLLAIPHFIILALLTVVALIVWLIAWFIILFTAKYPRPLFDFIVGYLRWGIRVMAYAFLLVTDKYPPFRLKP